MTNARPTLHVNTSETVLIKKHASSTATRRKTEPAEPITIGDYDVRFEPGPAYTFALTGTEVIVVIGSDQDGFFDWTVRHPVRYRSREALVAAILKLPPYTAHTLRDRRA